MNTVIDQFNKDYPIFEKKVKFLIEQNKKLKIFNYILFAVIFVLIVPLGVRFLLKVGPFGSLWKQY